MKKRDVLKGSSDKGRLVAGEGRSDLMLARMSGNVFL